MRRNRRTKIIATLGPASATQDTIESLFRAGADVFRINMSHTPHDRLRHFVATIRAIEQKYQAPIGILADLQGPKLRIGAMPENGIELQEGDVLRFDSSPAMGTTERVPLPHPEILSGLKPGHKLLIDDGRIRLVTLETTGDAVTAAVQVGGRLLGRKGVSVPDSLVATSALTDKDRQDLQAALEADVDWIAMSFVQRPEDVREVSTIVRGRAGIMAKIERPQAVERLIEIMDVADAIMVARGDLGVELPLEQVPGLQKQMTRGARRRGCPVVVATQMLESMISSPMPTRAEVSDVATAVFEGADAIMLSAESAAGQYPLAAVSTMNRIAEEVERDPTYKGVIQAQRIEPEHTGSDAIAAAARQIAETLDLTAIICWTASGATAQRVARERPLSHIVALSPHVKTARRLALLWGTHCVVTEDAHDLDDMVERACTLAHQQGFVRAGERVIVAAGVPLGTPGTTNMLRIAYVSTVQ